MDMETGKTDKAIAAAIAALPYRRPPGAFRARVMAAVRAEAAAQVRLAWALKGFAVLTGLWAALVAFFAAGPLLRLAVEYAPLAVEPGGPSAALRLLAARVSELGVSLVWLVSAARELLPAAAGSLPRAHEVLLAAAICLLLAKRAGPVSAAQRI